ncbi:hypothetical protein EZY14_004205 [Kordia sp. TARA_039_SRF]|nr:hypothetical protein EZY14_004205 [Kordia sp. TARA_039_SRF]
MKNLKDKPQEINSFLQENNNFIEFKDEAHQLIVKELGFEPIPQASKEAELLTRAMLKSLYSGKISKKNFKKGLIVNCNTVRGMIRKYYPEQVYLLEKKRPSVSYLYLGLCIFTVLVVIALIIFLYS